MSTLNLNSAHREYCSRPRDERYPSLAAMVEAAAEDHRLSAERTYALGALSVEPYTPDGATEAGLAIRSPRGIAVPTHWAFGQLCRLVGAPASYLGGLPADLASQCLTHGMRRSDLQRDVVLLARAPNGRAWPTVRAVTTETYGRVWDEYLYQGIADTLPSGFSAPATWDGEPSGFNRGDRDSFLFVVDGGSIVNDPSVSTRGDGAMYRGIMVRNSEVGAASVQIDRFMFRAICSNHQVWGGAYTSRYRRRHVGQRAMRDAVREIGRMARAMHDQPASADERIIRMLIDREVAETKDAVVSELVKLGATKTQATAAYDTCEATETASPRSYWGLAQGLTRVSQDVSNGWTDKRTELDRIAGGLLERGRVLVAA